MLDYIIEGGSVRIVDMGKIVASDDSVFNRNRVNLVNEQDKIIGQADKFEAHLGKGMLHQAVSLFLFRKNSVGEFELLIQKRSAEKIVGAHEWANTLCGNVAVGENHLACVKRRLKEELGVILPKQLLSKIQELLAFNYQVQCNRRYSERELDHLFGLFLNDQELSRLDVFPNPSEVQSYAWVNWSDLLKKQSLSGKKFSPWFKIFINNQEITAKIKQFLANAK